MNGEIQFANVISDLRSFAKKAFKRISGKSYHVTGMMARIKGDASEDMFPAYRKKCLTNKRTRFQCGMTFVVFVSEKIKDCLFNFERKC